MRRTSCEKGKARQVSGKPDAGRDHDLAHRAVAAKPFAGMSGQIAEFHFIESLQFAAFAFAANRPKQISQLTIPLELSAWRI